MKMPSLTAAAAAIAIVSGFGLSHHGVAAAVQQAKAPSTAHSAEVRPVLTAATTVDPSLKWLESAGGQAQVRFNNDVSTLAGALAIESDSPTVANHLVFEADARVMRKQAQSILATPVLLPTVHRAEYKKMLKDFITVANLLQPGPGYGTTAQDDAAWDAAIQASNIDVS